ncbi:long-chain fatty acid--CoA ligase [Acrocarpospora macrocephala]|uniref:Long-chain-fatty-acid--CoA ligase n=1 Tax=Acrocarpospora macrocephala TaxID=150177 RepID=A0A5M3WQM6_9ACTN|nr:long-chain-fatty-acid--CoA ligase [Acrocarpospora macrocephala]GES09591.1 long-chain-fatty-acid--CoA ligase [Acrocarpospora macrocephala]
MDADQLTVTRLLDRAADLFPDRVVVSGAERITYTDFTARVHRLAHVLDRLGVRRGQRVATLAWNGHRHLELYFAVPSSGAVLHTVNLRLTGGQIGEILRHAGDVVVFVDPDQAGLLAQALRDAPDVRSVVVLGDELPPEAGEGWLLYDRLLGDAPDTPFPMPELAETEPAATCYSSATTGRPKPVVYSHRAIYLHSMALAMADTWALSEADTVLPVVPMFHVNAWGIPFAAVWLGAGIVLPGPAPSPEDLARLIVEERVTFGAAVPTVWFGVLEHLRGIPLPDLRMLVSGGAPLPPALLGLADELDVPLVHSYGMTESTPLVLVGRTKSHLRGGPDRRLRQGTLVPGLRMSVRDESGAEVPRDGATPGELWLRGPWVAEGYGDDPRSATAFVDGWYRTGDVVNVDAEGYVKIVDRIADLVKSGGEWISTVDLENALMDHPAVVSACVVGVPHPRWTERPVAVIVPAAEVTDDELRAHLVARFPKWWLPDDFVRVAAVPLTSVGKFDKRAVRAMYPVAGR